MCRNSDKPVREKSWWALHDRMRWYRRSSAANPPAGWLTPFANSAGVGSAAVPKLVELRSLLTASSGPVTILRCHHIYIYLRERDGTGSEQKPEAVCEMQFIIANGSSNWNFERILKDFYEIWQHSSLNSTGTVGSIAYPCSRHHNVWPTIACTHS